MFKNLFPYYAATHLTAFVLYMRLTVTVFVLKRIYDNYLLINGYMAWGALIYGMASLTIARASDHFERRSCAIVGLLTVILASFALLLGGQEYPAFFLYATLAPLGYAIYFPSMEGFLAERTSARLELGRSLSKYNFSWSSGDFLGGLLAALLITTMVTTKFECMWFALVIGISLDAATIGILLIARKVDRPESESTTTDEPQEESLPNEQARQHLPHFAQAARWGLFFSSAALGIAIANFGKYAQDNGLPEDISATLNAGLPLANAVIFFLFGPRKFWRFNGPLHVASQGMMIAGLLLLGLWPTPTGLALGIFLVGCGFSTSFTLSLFYSLLHARYQESPIVTKNEKSDAPLSVKAKKEQHAYGRESGISEAFLGMGQMLGPLLCMGVIWLAHPDQMFFIVGAALAGVSLILQAWMLRPVLKSQNLERIVPGGAD